MTRVVLFRAQPFHNGHMYMINTALLDAMKYGDRVLVLVGSADKAGTPRNPIPIGVRLDLIYNSLVRAYDENMLRYYQRYRFYVLLQRPTGNYVELVQRRFKTVYQL